MLFTGSVLFLLCATTTQAFYAAPACTFDLMEDVRNPVTFIYENSKYILPEEKPTFQVNTDKPLLLYCPGVANKFKLSDALKTDRILQAACVNSETLKVSIGNYDIHELNCTSYFYGDIKTTTETCADGAGIIYRIGYDVSGTGFYPLVEVCHQKSTGKTFYTQHEFRQYSKPDKLKSLNGPVFQQGPYFREVTSIYDNQNNILTGLVGEYDTNKFMKSGGKLSRGHLTPSADFVISSNRRATYQLINTVPQWQSINEGNWNELEEKIRNKASKYHLDLKIVTGTYGVFSISNAEKEVTDIYLVDGNKMPVPQIIWKVVYNGKQGIAFLSVNSPIKPEKGDVHICKNICSAKMWGEWTDFKKGRIYCCEVKELQKIIKYLPVTGITDILKEN